MSFELNGRVCVVTGADEGVGRGIVEGFIQRGAKVAAGLYHAKSPVPEGALPIVMDVTQREQIAAAFQKVIETFGRIDVLINNAGIYPRKRADEMSPEEWLEVMETNLHGTWRCCHEAIPYLKQSRGRIINVGSITLRLGFADLSHYMASKGGVLGLTRGLARDLGGHGIRVNCVNLGAVQTEGEKKLFPDQSAVLELVEGNQCLKGRMTPQTVEPVFAFLASDLSNDITGQCLTVDRGWSHE